MDAAIARRLNRDSPNDFPNWSVQTAAATRRCVYDVIGNARRKKQVACAIEFLVHLMDKDVSSPDDEMVAACALAELFGQTQSRATPR
jgi:hypothetical protein